VLGELEVLFREGSVLGGSTFRPGLTTAGGSQVVEVPGDGRLGFDRQLAAYVALMTGAP
jgi:hypothetical protein